MKKQRRNNSWCRPRTLREVVLNADSVEDMGLNLAEFLDHINSLLRRSASRTKLYSAIRGEPPSTGNDVQDAYLAAVATHIANLHRLHRPTWVDKSSRHLDRPWFALPDPWARAWLLRDSPAAFRERNLFTTDSAIQRV